MACLSTKRLDHRVGVGHDGDVLQREVDRRVVPIGVHCRAAVFRHDYEEAFVCSGTRRVLDRHVGPGAGIDDHVAAGRL